MSNPVNPKNTNTPSSDSNNAINQTILAFLTTNDLDSLTQFSKSSLQTFHSSLSFLQDQLQSPSSNITRISVLKSLRKIVQEVQLIAVLALGNVSFVNNINKCNEADSGCKEEIKLLLESCLQVLPPDTQKKYIPLISSLYEDLFKVQVFPSREKPLSGFEELLLSCKNIMNLYEQRDETEYSNKVLISGAIAVIDKINATKGKGKDGFEGYVLDEYCHKVHEIKNALEVKKDNLLEAVQQKKDKQMALKSLPSHQQLKNRTFFMKEENLPFEESEEDEFKEYALPLNEHLEKTLKKVVCSLLNQRGGRIYIGVSDKRVVKGIRVNYPQRKELWQTFERIFASLDPEIPSEEPFKILYLPVYDSKTNTHINNLFVVKVIIEQGDPAILYSASKESLQSYIRYEGRCAFMSSRETREAIISRFLNPGTLVPKNEYNDPEPKPNDIIAYQKELESSQTGQVKAGNTNIEQQKPKDNKDNKDNVSGKGNEKGPCSKKDKNEETKVNKQGDNNTSEQPRKCKKKCAEKNYYPDMLEAMENPHGSGQDLLKVHEVFMEGLPLSWTQDEFNNFVDGLKFKSLYSRRMFRSEHGVCNGKAFLNFTDKDEAEHLIQIFNGSSLFGKQMVVRFKK